VLAGGYQYYVQHKDNLIACKNDTTLLKGNPRYDFAEIASQMGDAAANNQSDSKKTIEITRRKKTVVAHGGC
jgi:hypothetical protein